MDNATEVAIATAELYKRIQLFRLICDLTITRNKIKENQITCGSAGDGFLTRLGTGVSNSFKSTRLKTLVPQEQQIQERIRQFMASNQKVSDAPLPTAAEITKRCDNLFGNTSDDGLAKILFCLNVLSDAEYPYVYADDGLANLSGAVWGNRETIGNIKTGFRSVYTDIAKQPLSSTQKWILGGTAALALLTPFLAPVAFGGASAAAITGGLAGIGGTMVGGIGILAVAEMTLDGIAIATTYGALDASNKAKVRNAFRQMDLDAVAWGLARDAYMLQVAKRLDSESDYKERINKVLQMIQDLKSDTDYVLYVEREDVEKNKRKINLFHNFDTQLAKIVCV